MFELEPPVPAPAQASRGRATPSARPNESAASVVLDALSRSASGPRRPRVMKSVQNPDAISSKSSHVAPNALRVDKRNDTESLFTAALFPGFAWDRADNRTACLLTDL